MFIVAVSFYPPRSGQADPIRLRIALATDPVTLDPHALNTGSTNFVTRSIYETLVSRGKNSEKAPGLALAWDQVEPQRWRFALRRGVRFHDGSTFDADDVLFSLNRAMRGISGFGQFLGEVKRIEKVDAYTVDVLTHDPDPLLPDSLTRIFIMDHSWAARVGAEEPALPSGSASKFYVSEHANGTGPYKLVHYDPGNRVELESYRDWWGPRDGNVDQVVYLTIPAAGARIAALLAGDVDLVADVPPQLIETLRKRSDIRIESGPENRAIFLGFDQHSDALLHGNARDNPFKDRRVRQAIYQAIDAEAIRTNLMEGQSFPTSFLWAPSVFGYNAEQDKRLPVNYAAGRGLLKAAGYPTGFSVTLDCPADRYVNSREICQAIGAMLARVGITVTVNVAPFAVYVSRLTKLDTSFYFMSWAAPTFDAMYPLQALARSYVDGTADGAWNFGRYSNPALDAVIDQIKVTTDKTQRAELMRRAHDLLQEDVAYVPIHDQMIVWAMKKNISAVLEPENQLEVKWVRVE